MKAITLLYHDVVDQARAGTSGFSSAHADIYKLSPTQFEHHLDAIAGSGNLPQTTVLDLLKVPAQQHVPVFLSFDDGGASAYQTADMLDRRGWKGHFFIPTNFIGAPAFLDAQAIKDLHARGHVIGSHSCSHPERISHLDDAELGREWIESVQALESILGSKVETASVPGGFYSLRVARFAAAAGIRALFNSEPTVRFLRFEDSLICGRFGLQRDSPPQLARLFAMRDSRTLLRSAAFWNTKKLLKAAGGEHWLTFRKWWMAR